jgi:uncharacterized RDD family membrane protein YckC
MTNTVPPPPPPAATATAAAAAQATTAVPEGTVLSSLGKRFGGALLTGVLIVVTLGIGYLIWAAIAYGKGQTPAKQILKMYVIDTETGLPATWGKMFVRNVVIDGLLNSITFSVFWLVSSIWIFTNPERQRLTDKMVKTIVVDAPNGL